MKYCVLLSIVLLASGCSAQQKLRVNEAKAFFTVSSPGNIPVDESGNAINQFIVNRFVYLIIKSGDTPSIHSATVNGIEYSTETEKIQESRVEVGKLFQDNSPVVIKAPAGNNIWKVLMQTKDGKSEPGEQQNIILTGTLNNKPFKTVIQKEVQLTGPVHY